MYRPFRELIEKYDRITVYRHKSPDGDAVFSQHAFASFLKENYPQKEVRMCGKDFCGILDNREKTDEDFISDSLAVIFDSANSSRIDDESYRKAQAVVKIDHHPDPDLYGDLNYVDDKASAACEILAGILFSEDFRDLILSKEVCRDLYSGIVWDTLNFSTTNTTSRTLSIAAKLAEMGDLQVSEIAEHFFDMSLDTFEKVTKLRTRLTIEGRNAYILLSQEDLDELGLSYREAKDNIAEFGHIEGIMIWSIFCFNPLTGKYDGSLRSRKGYTINGLAGKYGGGGHKNASGVKDLEREKCLSLISELTELSTHDIDKTL